MVPTVRATRLAADVSLSSCCTMMKHHPQREIHTSIKEKSVMERGATHTSSLSSRLSSFFPPSLYLKWLLAPVPLPSALLARGLSVLRKANATRAAEGEKAPVFAVRD